MRPSTPEQMRRAAAQEWQVLFSQPSTPWSHPTVTPWVDAAGRLRGSPATYGLPHNLEGELLATLTPGPWIWQRWMGRQVRVIAEDELVVNGWVMWKLGAQWLARRVGPCHGDLHFVVHVDGQPLQSWPLDRWAQLHSWERHEWLLMRLGHERRSDVAEVGPLTCAEREKWLCKMKASRPGPSGWKLYYLRLFPEWVQDIYWTMLDVQRLRAIVVPCIKTALQVNLAKAKGGWRPLTMLEEEFKAIEGPTTQRCSLARSLLPVGEVCSRHNLAYERKQPAAADVLYLDALVVEDARSSGRPLARLPADYEKFFNAINLCQADAVMQARGVCDEARMLYQEAFQGLRIHVDTAWGPSEEVRCDRGVPQGAVSSPELSKPAQDPLLRLRERSSACYITSAGRRVAVAGFVDDAEHYAQGVWQLPQLLRDLHDGSKLTGVGYAWDKFSVLCTDWEDMLGSPEGERIGLTEQGVQVSGYDIWSGGTRSETLPRAREHDPEKLLGKRGTLADRNTLAAEDLQDKLDNLGRRLSTRHMSWDELIMSAQFFGVGHINYAPLIGIPPPVHLHRHDTAVQHLLLRALHVRSTSERVGLLAPRSAGGLQLCSSVESVLGALASELLRILNSPLLVGQLARDSFKAGMRMEPNEVSCLGGVVLRALEFLAGYGLFITASTVGRILDCVYSLQGTAPADTVGLFDARKFNASAKFCRVGKLANAVRSRVDELRRDEVPCNTWHSQALWEGLFEGAGVSAHTCAAAAGMARDRAMSDWAVECGLAQVAQREIPEDWDSRAWEFPDDALVDARSRHLDAVIAGFHQNEDCAMFADGGEDSTCCTYSGQARGFSPAESSWTVTGRVMPQICGKLPRRFGWENTNIHTSEFLAMLVALRWRRPDRWNLLVLDRSSLFPLLRACAEGDPTSLLRFSCAHLMTRLRAVKRELIRSWSGRDNPPLWRKDQLEHPERWTIAEPLPDGRERKLCHMAYCDHGMVGIDISSHQGPDARTIPVLVEETQGKMPAAHRRAPALFRRMYGGPLVAWHSNYHTRDGRSLSRRANSFGTG